MYVDIFDGLKKQHVGRYVGASNHHTTESNTTENLWRYDQLFLQCIVQSL